MSRTQCRGIVKKKKLGHAEPRRSTWVKAFTLTLRRGLRVTPSFDTYTNFLKLIIYPMCNPS